MSRESKQQSVARRFAQSGNAALCDSVLHQEIGQRLLTRLELIKLSPNKVLDLGCGDGLHAKALQQHYGAALVLAVDKLLPQAALASSRKLSWRKRLASLVADAGQQPLVDESIDLIFSNLMLHWLDQPLAVVNEISRILAPGGLVMFSCYGPDTLLELRNTGIDFAEFVDMHDLGDDLVASGLGDPVMEMEKLTLKYTSSEKLLLDLDAAGLILPQQREAFIASAVVEQRNAFNLTVEVVYGHAWKPQKTPDSGSFKGIQIKPA